MNIEEISILESNEEIINIFEGDSNETITPFQETGTDGTKDYEKLKNKPQINTIELIGNRTSSQLGLQDKMHELSNIDIKNLIGE